MFTEKKSCGCKTSSDHALKTLPTVSTAKSCTVLRVDTLSVNLPDLVVPWEGGSQVYNSSGMIITKSTACSLHKIIQKYLYSLLQIF